MPSRAEELGAALGLDVEGSRARHAAARGRYRAAITEALDRLCDRMNTEGDIARAIPREPVPYAAAGMADPFERREVDGRGETNDSAPTSGAGGAVRGVAGSVGDPRPTGQRQRAVPVPVRVPEGARRVG